MFFLLSFSHYWNHLIFFPSSSSLKSSNLWFQLLTLCELWVLAFLITHSGLFFLVCKRRSKRWFFRWELTCAALSSFWRLPGQRCHDNTLKVLLLLLASWTWFRTPRVVSFWCTFVWFWTLWRAANLQWWVSELRCWLIFNSFW